MKKTAPKKSVTTLKKVAKSKPAPRASARVEIFPMQAFIYVPDVAPQPTSILTCGPEGSEPRAVVENTIRALRRAFRVSVTVHHENGKVSARE